MKKKSQVSIELVMVVTLGIGLTLMSLAAFYIILGSSEDEIARQQITQTGNDLTSTVDRLYYRGSGSQVEINVNFPRTIVNMSIEYRYVNETLNYTYINISELDYPNSQDHLFFLDENYIHITCSKCYGSQDVNFQQENFSLTYLPEDFSEGSQKFFIRAIGDRVEVNPSRKHPCWHEDTFLRHGESITLYNNYEANTSLGETCSYFEEKITCDDGELPTEGLYGQCDEI